MLGLLIDMGVKEGALENIEVRTKINKAFWAALVTLHPSEDPEMGDGRKEVMLSLLTLK